MVSQIKNGNILLLGLNSSFSKHLAPIQDVSVDGINIIPQLKAEFGEGCIVLKDISHLESKLKQVQKILNKSQPVIFLFYPDVLSQAVTHSFHVAPRISKPYTKANLVFL